jgi:hypothetical protein
MSEKYHVHNFIPNVINPSNNTNVHQKDYELQIMIHLYDEI